MAGLCVSVTFDAADASRSDVHAMVAASPFRSADGVRTWWGAGAALAHQRRLLLPEDAADLQPLCADGLVLACDARIDNREELLAPLRRHGLILDATADGVPDSEFVLAAFRLWGADCARHLIGDFAFVVWDTRRKRLFASRDPMGMRSLYYHWDARRRLVAGTDVVQVLAVPWVPRAVREAAVAVTLAGPYLPASWTMYEGVEQVPPGHSLTADVDGLRTWRAWAPDPASRFQPEDERAAHEAYRAGLEQAVEARLRCVRPVGIFLSGGLDSVNLASTAGRLCREAPQHLHAYAWAFEELVDSDERGVSDHVVRRYEMPATAFPADDSWPLAGYPEHGPDEDDAFSWSYEALMDRTLDRCRDDGMGIALTGDRGDELTGDWAFDELGLLAAGRVRDALVDLRAASSIGSEVVRPLARAHLPGLVRRRTARLDASLLWPVWVPADLARRVELADIIAESRRVPAFGNAARSVRHQRLFSPHLARVATLRQRRRAHRGLGFADPYTDRRLVELVLSMAPWLVQRRSQPKAMARAALVGVTPEPARCAAKRNAPVGLFERGFRERAVPVVHDLLTGSRAAAHGWLDESAARAVYQQYLATGHGDGDFWWPLTVEMWLRRWWSEGTA